MSLDKALEVIGAKQKVSSEQKSAFTPYQSFHLFSNQSAVDKIYTDLEKTPSLKVKNKNNMAVLIGESSFVSLAPVLAGHVDTILMLDIDPRVLQHNLFIIDCFKKSNHPEQFCQLLCGEESENPVFKLNIIMDYVKVKAADGTLTSQPPMLLNEELYKRALAGFMGLAGQVHFLHSAENFWRAKQAIAKLTFHTIQVDFFNTELMELLGKTLFDNNVHIPLINVSNLYDYDGPHALRKLTRDKLGVNNGKVYAALAALLYRPEEAYILYGMMDPNKNYSCLISRFCIGLSQYKHETSAYLSALNAREILEHYTKEKKSLFPETVPNQFFKKNQPTVVFITPLIMQLRDFLSKRFPNATLQVDQSPEKYLIDADISLNFKDGIFLLNLIRKYNFPYKFIWSDGKFVVTLLEINVKGKEILEMLESTNLSVSSVPRP